MRLYTIFLRLSILITIILVIFYFYSIHVLNSRDNERREILDNKPEEITKKHENSLENIQFKRYDIVVAVVACGESRLYETLNMLKSALMFSKEKLNFIIFTEDNLIENFSQKLSEWQSFTNNGFTFKVMPLIFPTNNSNEWKRLFKPCAAQRLFLPNILTDVDSILYMDTDTLFLTPVESVWEHFNRMNSSQMAALVQEHEDPNVGWYNRFAKHPYYGELGVNSGVMLMNLTRMRLFKWSEYITPIYKKYKLKITWGDQDIINIIFHYHPDKLYIYSCRYNYRPDHCMYMSVCKPAEKDGVAIIHGSRGFFHSEKQPVFQAIYRAFDEFHLGGDIFREFYQPLETYLDLVENTNCGHVKDIFLKNLKRIIDIDYNNR